MSGVQFTLTGDDAVGDHMARLEQAMGATAEVLDQIGAFGISEITQLFRDGTDPFGNPWPLSNRALAEGGKTLVDRGHLRDANTYEVNADSVTFGNNLSYARIHNEGYQGLVSVAAHQRVINQAFGRRIPDTVVDVSAHQRRVDVPQRQFMPTDDVPNHWDVEILRIIDDALLGTVQ